jgi:hypothetical protein
VALMEQLRQEGPARPAETTQPPAT